MRAALSILSLVIVMAVVLWLARSQQPSRTPGSAVPPSAAPASSPEALGRQVEQLLEQGAAKRASDIDP